MKKILEDFVEALQREHLGTAKIAGSLVDYIDVQDLIRFTEHYQANIKEVCMVTTRERIRNWIKNKPQSARWMIVACDTFDWSDFPIYAHTVADFDAQYAEFDQVNMHKIMEVYDLSADIDQQLAEHRCFRLPSESKYAARTQ